MPERAAELRAVKDRLVDLLPVVRNHVAHPAFGKGFSLKAVVPALLPEQAHDDLAVADGGTASDLLDALLLDPDALGDVTSTSFLTTCCATASAKRSSSPTCTSCS